jgi:hypothetical protein
MIKDLKQSIEPYKGKRYHDICLNELIKKNEKWYCPFCNQNVGIKSKHQVRHH